MTGTTKGRGSVGPHQRALTSLFRTTDAVRRALAQVLEPHGLTGQQYNVLRILRGARPDPLPVMEIADRMMEQTPGITRLLDRLEAKGLVSRVRCLEDRRQVHCSITEAGLALLEALDEPVKAADEALLGVLDRAELERLIDALERVRTHAG